MYTRYKGINVMLGGQSVYDCLPGILSILTVSSKRPLLSVY